MHSGELVVNQGKQLCMLVSNSQILHTKCASDAVICCCVVLARHTADHGRVGLSTAWVASGVHVSTGLSLHEVHG